MLKCARRHKRGTKKAGREKTVENEVSVYEVVIVNEKSELKLSCLQWHDSGAVRNKRRDYWNIEVFKCRARCSGGVYQCGSLEGCSFTPAQDMATASSAKLL